MSTNDRPRRPQSWEHLLEKDPHSGAGFRVGIVAALLIHTGIFAITWPIGAQAPPADPEPVLIRFPITEFNPERPEPEIIPIEVPPLRPQGPPIISVPPERPAEPVERPLVAPIEIPQGPVEYFTPPVDITPPPEIVEPPTVIAGVEITAPNIIEKIEPRYTETARRACIEGVVILDCIIDTEGRVESVTVLRGLPLGLTKNAVEAVNQWRFEASEYNGHKVSVRYILTVHFSLRQAGG